LGRSFELERWVVAGEQPSRHPVHRVGSNRLRVFQEFRRNAAAGFELNLNSRISRFNLDGGYTFLDATYQSPETVDGSSNSANDAAAKGA
jgi:hypothetical protein